MENAMIILGLIAALVVLTGYYGLESGRLSSNRPLYYFLNASSSAVLLVTIAWQYDKGDSGALFMESCWLLISLKGMLRTWRRKAHNEKAPS